MRHSWILLLVACGHAQLEPMADAGTDAEPAPLPVDAPEGAQPTPECAADPALCLYRPPALPIELVELTATDPARVGGARTVNLAVRFSRMAAQPMPVVIWSPGGTTGTTNAAAALDKWAIAAAEAGYLSVAIAHTPRDQAQRDALCAELGFDAAGCATFRYLSYDRPHDIALAIDKLAELATQPPYQGRYDLAKLAIGGHSAGAGGALMVGGAPRRMNGAPVLIADPRPLAFLAFSPQAPGSEGMFAAGYSRIARPTLIGTGRGDDNPPDTADGRASVFELVQPGNNARIFVEDPTAVHTLFALETEACAMNATVERCEAMRDWIESAGLAFLDAHVRGLPSAIAWLGSSNLARASAGVAEWSTR